MKFVNQALAFALMSFTSVEAHKTFSKQDFSEAVAAGRINQKKLFKNAVPLNQDGLRRRVEDAAEAEEAEYAEEYEAPEAKSTYQLQFNSCISMETQNYNLLLSDLMAYTKSGTLLSVANYVLFDLCDGDDCEQQTYMIDLLTFIEAVVSYGPDRKESICNACQTYGEDVCGKTYYGNAEVEEEQDEDAEDEADGGRRLDSQYEVFDDSMCTQCESYECWYDSEGDQDEDFDEIEAWISEIAECKETDAPWNGLTTYAGWMCNADGSGIEIGIFIDEYCSMYASNLQYSSIMQEDDYKYFFQSQDVIPFMLHDIIDCRDLDSISYVNEATYEGLVEAGYENAEGDVSEACQNLFEGEFVPRSVNDCGEVKTWTSEELANMQAAYSAEDYDQSQEGQNMYQYVQAQQMSSNSYGQDYSWYTYDLSALDILDDASICERVSAKWEYYGYVTAAAADSGISNAYSNLNSTSNFWKAESAEDTTSTETASSSSDSSRLFPTRNSNSAIQTADKSLSTLEIAWIILGSALVTAAFMHLTRKQILKRKAKKQEPAKEVYVRTDDKGSPLIIS